MSTSRVKLSSKAILGAIDHCLEEIQKLCLERASASDFSHQGFNECTFKVLFMNTIAVWLKPLLEPLNQKFICLSEHPLEYQGKRKKEICFPDILMMIDRDCYLLEFKYLRLTQLQSSNGIQLNRDQLEEKFKRLREKFGENPKKKTFLEQPCQITDKLRGNVEDLLVERAMNQLSLYKYALKVGEIPLDSPLKTYLEEHSMEDLESCQIKSCCLLGLGPYFIRID